MTKIKRFPYDEIKETGDDVKLIEEETDDLTKDNKDVLMLKEVGMYAHTVNAIILEAAQAVEGRLVKTLGNQINDMIKPLKQSRIEYLEQELNVANFIMMEIQETYLGMFLLKRIHKKIRLDAEKKVQKDKDVVVRVQKDFSGIIKEGSADVKEN